MNQIDYLITNTAFGKTLQNYSDSDYRRVRDSFDKFLNDDCKIWMFIPCNQVCGEWMPIEEPEYYKFYNHLNFWADSKFEGFFDDEEDFKSWQRECRIYQDAKDSVLFAGFKLIDEQSKVFIVKSTQTTLGIGFKNGKHKKIEDLTEYNLALTDYAKALIYPIDDIDMQQCIGCNGMFDCDTMKEDNASEKYCAECWNEMWPVMQQEYLEMVDKGEIDPDEYAY